MNTCGWCKNFKPNKHDKHIVGGWFVGDGRCEINNNVTVIGDSCQNFGVDDKGRRGEMNER